MKQHSHTDLDNIASSILKRQKWTIVSTKKIQIRSIPNFFPAYCILNTNYGSEEDWECLSKGRTASPLDEIFGLIADCASLQRDLAVSFCLLSPTRELAFQGLLQRCSELEKLQKDWCSRNNKDFFPSTNHESPEDDPESLRNLTLSPHEFGSLDIAKTYCLFWISSIVVKRVIYQIQKQLPGTPDPISILSSAREICRTVAFCMKPSTQMSVGHLALFGISQVSKGCIDCGHVEMFNWCQYIYSIIQSRGIGLAGRVSREDWAFWQLAENQTAFQSHINVNRASL